MDKIKIHSNRKGKKKQTKIVVKRNIFQEFFFNK